jgi:hypothetical protein
MRLLTVVLIMGLFAYGVHVLLELANASLQYTNTARGYAAPLELPR